MSLPPDTIPDFARQNINLASESLGARAVFATDEFFAPLARLLQDSTPVFVPDKYDEHGKWMDGWESRRRRDGGHDHAVIALATAGRITGFDIDTSHFTGNYPPACHIEACQAQNEPDASTTWYEILPMQALGANAHHYAACHNGQVWTHIRLHIYPDGGVARLRVYGVPHLDLDAIGGQEIDLAAALNGGRIIAFSNAHYGHMHRLLAPGRSLNMGDGWETRRRREPGHDWIIIALAARANITRATIDTAFFKGNFPDRCALQAADLSDFPEELSEAIVTSSMFWPMLLPEQKLTADAEHPFQTQIKPLGPVTHIRLNIYPDGGVSRLRVFGRIA